MLRHLLGNSQRRRNGGASPSPRGPRAAGRGAVVSMLAAAAGGCFPSYDYDLPAGAADRYGDAVRADAPVRWLRLDEAAGADRAVDSSGGEEAVAYGSPMWGEPAGIAASVGTSLRLDGIDTTVALPGPLGLVGTVPFSIEAWVRPLAVTEKNLFVFGNAVGSDADRDGYNMVISGSGKVALARWSEGAYAESRGGPVSEDEWHHVVGTFDGAVLQIYLDAVPGEPGDELLAIGAESMSPTFGAPSAKGQPFFEGWLDELAVYDHALGADRISAHHAIGRGE